MTASTEFYLLMLAFAALGLLIITLGWALMWAHETPRVVVVVLPDPDEVYDQEADDPDIRLWELELHGEAS